jgi:hypothetical protein
MIMNTRVPRLLVFPIWFIITFVTNGSGQSLTAVDSFATPASIPFGLEWIDGNLWHSDRSSHLIYKIDPATHAVIRSFSPGVSDPAGLAWNGTQLFCADWTGGKIFRIDTSTGAALDSFPSPNGSPFGLTWDGSNLWCTEVFAGRLCKLDAHGSVLQYFEYPFWLGGVTYDGTQFWVAAQERVVNGTRRLYRISTSGDTLSSYASPGPYPEDLAWDGSHLWVCDNSGKIYEMAYVPTEVAEGTTEMPASYSLGQNYPNPFNPQTSISYGIPHTSRVRLTIVNASGQEVATLVDEEKSAGSYQVIWRASNHPSGVYFYRLTAGRFVETRRLLLLK